MATPEKIKTVEEVAECLSRAQSVVLVDYKGLTVAQMTDLRRRLRETGSDLKVVKNRLTKRSLAEAGCEALDDLLRGPVALAFGYDEPSGPAKVCAAFAKEAENLKVRGGLLSKARIDLAGVLALARLPGRVELLTQVATTMLAPARQMATAMKQAMTKIVYAFRDRATQLES
ncbi:50S ribosomal protein L10 [Candidatus Sumerlaeota bacterium]|nr:50S ribosomal protein L10 [Candidatus Sumerlaeota bacterium]